MFKNVIVFKTFDLDGVNTNIKRILDIEPHVNAYADKSQRNIRLFRKLDVKEDQNNATRLFGERVFAPNFSSSSPL